MLTHLKDVMKKLREAEKVKIKLFDTLESMQDETQRYYHNYLMKNIAVSTAQLIFLENHLLAVLYERPLH